MQKAGVHAHRSLAGAVVNLMKTGLAHAGILGFRITWRLAKKMSGRSLPAKEHYYIMRIFRLLFRSYHVRIGYPNPLAPRKTLHLHLDLCENSHQWYFRERGSYDALEFSLFAEEMKNADAFVDIGANIGVYATTIAQAFPEKTVTAVEPLEKNFETLKANVELNGLTNCVLRKGAVSNTDTPLVFYINPIHDGGGSLIAPEQYRTGDVLIDAGAYKERHPEFESSVVVETFSMDSLVEKRSVVKIDVEGAEAEVIRSGGDKLRQGLVDLLVVEVQQETCQEVAELMGEWGFGCFLLPDYAPIAFGEKLPWFVRNIVCARMGTAAHARISRRGRSK